MNLELPFEEIPPEELDQELAKIDRELDALFLEYLDWTAEQLKAERLAGVTAAA